MKGGRNQPAQNAKVRFFVFLCFVYFFGIFLVFVFLYLRIFLYLRRLTQSRSEEEFPHAHYHQAGSVKKIYVRKLISWFCCCWLKKHLKIGQYLLWRLTWKQQRGANSKNVYRQTRFWFWHKTGRINIQTEFMDDYEMKKKYLQKEKSTSRLHWY